MAGVVLLVLQSFVGLWFLLMALLWVGLAALVGRARGISIFSTAGRHWVDLQLATGISAPTLAWASLVQVEAWPVRPALGCKSAVSKHIHDG